MKEQKTMIKAIWLAMKKAYEIKELEEDNIIVEEDEYQPVFYQEELLKLL